MDRVDFSGAFETLWARADVPQAAAQIMTWAGLLLILWAGWQWVWSRHKGRGQGASVLAWPLAIGAALAAPAVIIPMVLVGVDAVVNLALSLAVG